MGGFFQPWRRKIGVVTLVIACVFAVGMVRSSFLRDRLRVKIGRTDYCLISLDGFCRLSRYVSDDPPPLILWDVRSADAGGQADVVDSAPIKWHRHFDWYGLEIGEGDFRNGTVPIAVIAAPYWIFLPFTIASAYLLFSKPRRSTRGESLITTAN